MHLARVSKLYHKRTRNIYVQCVDNPRIILAVACAKERASISTRIANLQQATERLDHDPVLASLRMFLHVLYRRSANPIRPYV